MAQERNYTVVLVTLNDIPVTVGVGSYTFAIHDNKVTDNKDQRLGSELSRSLKYYEQCFELAQFAWEMKEFDKTEDNTEKMR